MRDLGDGLDAAGFPEAEIPDAMENLQKVFDQLDSNGNGFIDVWEAQWIRRLPSLPRFAPKAKRCMHRRRWISSTTSPK